MEFINSASDKEMKNAFEEVKQIMYQTIKRVHNKYWSEYRYEIYCPCKNCTWYERVQKNFKIKDIQEMIKKFLLHINTSLRINPTYEHLRLSKRIFGEERTEAEAIKHKVRLTDQLKEIDKYFFLNDYEKLD